MQKPSFKKVEQRGEGTYGVVYKAQEIETGRIVAIKKVRSSKEDEGIPATTIREINLLKIIKHHNILDLTNVIHNGEEIYLVFEYVKTDLKQILNLLLPCAKHFSSRQNILVDEDYSVKLADFGLARSASVPLRVYTQEIITLWYRPPELLLGAKYYDSSFDIWSIACIMYELYTNSVLFPGESEIDHLHKIYDVLGVLRNRDWKHVENLENYNRKNYTPKITRKLHEIKHKQFRSILEMLRFNPIERMTAEEIL